MSALCAPSVKPGQKMRNLRCKCLESTSGSPAPRAPSPEALEESGALPAPGDGWLTSAGLSQRYSPVHPCPPASWTSSLSLAQDNLITVKRLSLFMLGA